MSITSSQSVSVPIHSIILIFFLSLDQYDLEISNYLDGQGVEIDLLKGLDLQVLDQASQLGDGHPLKQKLTTH